MENGNGVTGATWSDWGNGQGANYHKYPVSNGVEIKEIEVKF